jgi:hypothetical protein
VCGSMRGDQESSLLSVYECKRTGGCEPPTKNQSSLAKAIHSDINLDLN